MTVMVDMRWSWLILVGLCISLTTCSITSKIKDELLSEHEKHSLHPSFGFGFGFGLQQLQHAASTMNSLWSNKEDVHRDDKPVERYVKEYNPEEYATEGYVKRGVTELPPPSQQMCYMGILQYNVTLQNSCAGYTCTVYEAVCTNDTVVTTIYPNATNIRTFPWSQCEVTKLLCFLNGRAELVDMKEQYGVTNCSLITDSITCWSLQPFGVTCIVQVTCSNYTNWGSYAWGLECATDRLYCGDTNVHASRFNSYQHQIVDGQCRVETHGCAERTVPHNCSKLNLTCGYQEFLGFYGGCDLLRMDVACPISNSTYSNCSIAQINCNGTIKDADIAHVNQSECSIYSLSCNDVITPLKESTCTPVQMTCNGTRTSYANYGGALSLCSMTQVRCGSTGNCTTFELACPEAPKCYLQELPCSYTCQRMLNTSSCICPDDYTGRFCESQQQFSCSASLVYPPVSCLPSPTADPKDALLGGDRKCTVFDDYEGNATLGYLLDCAFAHPDLVNYSSINFTYWAKNDKISISQEVAWALRYKIFNFNQLFDSGGSLFTGNLTSEQILGDQLVWFNYSLKKVPEKFWYARRLYYELRFNPRPSGNTTFLRNFVDAPTRPISTKTFSKISTFTLVIIFGSIAVFLGFVGFVSYKCYRVYHEEKPRRKLKY